MSKPRLLLSIVMLLPCLYAAGAVQARGFEHSREGFAPSWRGEPGWQGEARWRSEPVWHGDISRFREHDIDRWRAGRWFNGRHDGRLGWWWIVGGAWYFYPGPVYPYPDPYQPPLVTLPPPAGAPNYWYYCANPPGYYPYVAECAGGWQQVPATAPSAGTQQP